MPLQANLRDISPTQVLNLINLAGKTGVLTIYEGVDTDEKDAMNKVKQVAGEDRAQFAFKTGKMIYASAGEQDGNLVSVLNKAGKLTDVQAKLIHERAKNSSDKAIALRLINANYVTQNDVVTSIQQHMLDVVYNMMTWKDGIFRFEDNVMPSSHRILVPIDLENVIIEGSRHIQENEMLLKEIPDLGYSLKFPENPKEKFKGVHLSVDEWKVVSYVNPRNSIRQIAKVANMSDMEIRRVVYGLMMAGLVILVQPLARDAVAKPVGKGEPPPKVVRKPQVKKDVVNRLIERITSL